MVLLVLLMMMTTEYICLSLIIVSFAFVHDPLAPKPFFVPVRESPPRYQSNFVIILQYYLVPGRCCLSTQQNRRHRFLKTLQSLTLTTYFRSQRVYVLLRTFTTWFRPSKSHHLLFWDVNLQVQSEEMIFFSTKLILFISCQKRSH